MSQESHKLSRPIKFRRLGEKKHVNLAFPSLNGTFFFHRILSQKRVPKHMEIHPQMFTCPWTTQQQNSTYKSVIKISCVGQVGHGISTPLENSFEYPQHMFGLRNKKIFFFNALNKVFYKLMSNLRALGING